MPPPKKTARPRIDAVIRHIKAGSYDGEIAALRDAIDERNRQRQEAVLQMVKETFGQEYTVAGPSEPNPPRSTPARRPRPGGSPSEAEVPADPELAAAEERARKEEEALRAETEGEEDGAEGSPDIESRSPIISGIGGSPQPED
jgi:hypothetical protein